MKKLTFISLTFIALFISSHANALEARIPTTSISKALETSSVKNLSNKNSYSDDNNDSSFDNLYGSLQPDNERSEPYILRSVELVEE